MLLDLRGIIILPWAILFLYMQGLAYLLVTKETRAKALNYAERDKLLDRLRADFYRNSTIMDLKIIGLVHFVIILVILALIVTDAAAVKYRSATLYIIWGNLLLQVIYVRWILHLQQDYLLRRGKEEDKLKNTYVPYSVMLFECPPGAISFSGVICLITPVALSIKLMISG